MNPRDKAKLRQRALRLAERPDTGQSRELEIEVAVVLLGEVSIGVPVDLLREIVRRPAVTALAALPPQFMGLVQIRGELISVIDLGRLLDLGSVRDEGLLAIVELDGRALGLAADGLTEFREIFSDEMAKDFEEGPKGAAGLLRGVTRDLLPILDPEKLLNDERVAVRMEQQSTSEEADPSADSERST